MLTPLSAAREARLDRSIVAVLCLALTGCGAAATQEQAVRLNPASLCSNIDHASRTGADMMMGVARRNHSEAQDFRLLGAEPIGSVCWAYGKAFFPGPAPKDATWRCPVQALTPVSAKSATLQMIDESHCEFEAPRGAKPKTDVKVSLFVI